MMLGSVVVFAGIGLLFVGVNVGCSGRSSCTSDT